MVIYSRAAEFREIWYGPGPRTRRVWSRRRRRCSPGCRARPSRLELGQPTHLSTARDGTGSRRFPIAGKRQKTSRSRGQAGTARNAFRDRPFDRLGTSPRGKGHKPASSPAPLPARSLHSRRRATRAGGSALRHDGVGDRRRGASSPRINSARWWRRGASAGPAVGSAASICASIRGSATARGRSGRSRYGELFISVPLFGFLGRASEQHWRRELETPQRRARAYFPYGSCISRTPGMVRA
jgi:hypothetical protein